MFISYYFNNYILYYELPCDNPVPGTSEGRGVRCSSVLTGISYLLAVQEERDRIGFGSYFSCPIRNTESRLL